MRHLQFVRRGGGRRFRAPLPPPPDPLWGAYDANPNFSYASLPESVRAYAQESANIWETTWTQNYAGYSLNAQGVSSKFDAYDFRVTATQILAVADAAWMTGDPAYLTRAQAFVENQLTQLQGSGSIEDIFGGRMYDPDQQSRAGWVSMRLNEPFAYASMAVLTRLLHESGVASSTVSTATLRLQEHWRRWQTGAWGSCGLSWGPSCTPSGSASLTHDDPNPDYRNFSHCLMVLAVTAWTLYKITGNANYQTGMNVILNRVGYGIGEEVDVSPARLTWVHMPNQTGSSAMWAYQGQGTNYAPHVPASTQHIARENGLNTAGWSNDAVQRGVAWFIMRDAGDHSNQMRGDTAGGCGSACSDDEPVIITPYTPGGLYEEPDGNLSVWHSATARATLPVGRLWAQAPHSTWWRTYLGALRDASNSAYWRSPSSAVGLLLNGVANL